MITAKEALQIQTESHKVILDHLKYIEERILEAASQGDLSLVIRKEPYKSFMKQAHRGGIHYANKTAQSVVESLQKRGFLVYEYYKEKHFGADTGLCIEWSNPCV
ncbi:hypothetical protein [Pasteurella phage vB_PmuP_PHB02]|uniref:Uncharacterized protein n=1 Tax=Pasteurella phage vB_PmuP_PHB02 TaxID=2005054 RepID=A0A1Y0T1C6_9CAUD|nr:hypothetical protein HOR82_gp35 [Pasteurella phage vB_PmuP_PHB02]ARV77599.1 hypothetical protein [Pasteurella phage vB_PmuP_PHB02]